MRSRRSKFASYGRNSVDRNSTKPTDVFGTVGINRSDTSFICSNGQESSTPTSDGRPRNFQMLSIIRAAVSSFEQLFGFVFAALTGMEAILKRKVVKMSDKIGEVVQQKDKEGFVYLWNWFGAENLKFPCLMICVC